MTKEIKFRIWQNVTQPVMAYFGIKEISEGVDLEDKKDWKVMQFTGLLDKNGKEIYEGDVIEWYRLLMDCKSVEKVGQVMKFHTRKMTAQFTGVSGEHWRTVEVIGNIYENPELLSKYQ